MSKSAAAAFLITLLLVLLVGCREGELIREMVVLDRNFISALTLTAGNGDRGSAIMAVKEFKLQWTTFKVRYSKFQDGDPEWTETFERIDEKVRRADGFVNTGNLKGAHSALEGIRVVFMELRKKYGIDYFLDYIMEFSVVMEPVVETADDKRLSPAELDLIDRTLPEALRLWSKVRSAKFDKNLYSFSDTKLQRLEGHFDEISSALDDLAAAMGQNDRRAMLNAVRRIKPPFSRSMKMFGQDSFI